jgi:fatty-acyl-CoA synthase
VIARAFDPGETLALMSDPELGISHFLGVPAIYNALRDHPANATSDFSRMRVVLAGAEAVPVSLVRWWGERGLLIQEGYGMTENVASCMAVSREDVLDHVGSAGKPLRHIQMRVMREDGTEAEAGESGELWCRGPVVTPGYWKRPEANEESFVDGWFRTGDIGSKDADGYFYIEDRLKDMYISGGENVYPAEVENLLYEMPEIREVAVIGLPDEKWGEVGCAVVALKEGQSLSPEQLFDFCRPRLARFKQPHRVEFVSELPRNATGKVLKFELRKQFADSSSA